MIAYPETLLLLAGAALAIFLIHRYFGGSVRSLPRFDDNPHGADHVADIGAGDGDGASGDGGD